MKKIYNVLYFAIISFIISIIPIFIQQWFADSSDYWTWWLVIKSLSWIDDTFFTWSGNIYLNADSTWIDIYNEQWNLIQSVAYDWSRNHINRWTRKITTDSHTIIQWEWAWQYYSYSTPRCWVYTFIYDNYTYEWHLYEQWNNSSNNCPATFWVDSDWDLVWTTSSSTNWTKVAYSPWQWDNYFNYSYSSPNTLTGWTLPVVNLPSAWNAYFQKSTFWQAPINYDISYNSTTSRHDFKFTEFTFSWSEISWFNSIDLPIFEQWDTYYDNTTWQIATKTFLPYDYGLYISMRFNDTFIRTCLLDTNYQKQWCVDWDYYMYKTWEDTWKKVSDPSWYFDWIDFSSWNVKWWQYYDTFNDELDPTYIYDNVLYSLDTFDFPEWDFTAPWDDTWTWSTWSWTTSEFWEETQWFFEELFDKYFWWSSEDVASWSTLIEQQLNEYYDFSYNGADVIQNGIPCKAFTLKAPTWNFNLSPEDYSLCIPYVYNPTNVWLYNADISDWAMAHIAAFFFSVMFFFWMIFMFSFAFIPIFIIFNLVLYVISFISYWTLSTSTNFKASKISFFAWLAMLLALTAQATFYSDFRSTFTDWIWTFKDVLFATLSFTYSIFFSPWTNALLTSYINGLSNIFIWTFLVVSIYLVTRKFL